MSFKSLAFCAAVLTTLLAQPKSFAQTFTIKSQVLNQDTIWDYPSRPIQFEKDAVVVTNGFQLTIKGQSITAEKALIVSFQSRAVDGPNGANGSGYGGNGSDGTDGSYGRRGSKVTLQAGQFIGQTNSLIVRVTGEDAGNAGNGGDGASGNNGGPGDGPDVSDCWIGSCRRAGGNGGMARREGMAGTRVAEQMEETAES
jgi:hypothetical protein